MQQRQSITIKGTKDEKDRTKVTEVMENILLLQTCSAISFV